MSHANLWGLLAAQVAAEVKSRLRSFPSAVAVVAILAAAFFWIPDPSQNATSLSWRPPGQPDHVISGLYTSSYVGLASAILSSLFLGFIGFYLVAGSIRRDRQTGVGAILAATPLTNFAYLLGKVVAHTVYLTTVSLAALASGLAIFVLYGQGPFELLGFLAPYGLLVLPAMASVAACAVFFDVTPLLRTRGGWVIYFFVWSFGLLLLPGLLAGEGSDDPAAKRPPIFDPLGLATALRAIESSSGLTGYDIGIGLEIVETPIERIAWEGPRWTPSLVGLRVLPFVFVLALTALAAAIFDRFDPAKQGSKAPKNLAVKPTQAELAATSPPSYHHLADLGHPHLAPSLGRSIAAEALLLWSSAGYFKWPLVLAALLAGIPALALPGGAAFLLLLGPVLAEGGAREELAGTELLIRAQPGVPNLWTGWKLAATLVFLAPFALPRLVSTLLIPGAFVDQGLAFVVGLVFVAAFAVAAARLTGGGKLFTAVHVALWYAALNGATAFDFCAILGPAPSLARSGLYAVGSLPLIGLALVRDRYQAGYLSGARS